MIEIQASLGLTSMAYNVVLNSKFASRFISTDIREGRMDFGPIKLEAGLMLYLRVRIRMFRISRSETCSKVFIE